MFNRKRKGYHEQRVISEEDLKRFGGDKYLTRYLLNYYNPEYKIRKEWIHDKPREYQLAQEFSKICSTLQKGGIAYAFTGMTAVYLYGFGLGGNVTDIALKNKKDLIKALRLFEVKPLTYLKALIFDKVIIDLYGYKIRFEPDIIENSYVNADGLRIQNKVLLLKRLEISLELSKRKRKKSEVTLLRALIENADSIGKYKYNWKMAEAAAFIALTKNAEITEKYKYHWNRL